MKWGFFANHVWLVNFDSRIIAGRALRMRDMADHSRTYERSAMMQASAGAIASKVPIRMNVSKVESFGLILSRRNLTSERIKSPRRIFCGIEKLKNRQQPGDAQDVVQVWIEVGQLNSRSRVAR